MEETPVKTLIALGASALLFASLAGASTDSPSTTRVSVSSSGGEGNLASYPQGLSADARYVAFTSLSSNLVPGDTNDRQDAFVRDRVTGETERVSLSNTGAEGEPGPDPFGGSATEGISADGRYVVFRSDAPNLVDGDTNGAQDVFVRDRQRHFTMLISAGRNRAPANGPSAFAAISADGRYVAFSSVASNLIAHDTNGVGDIFVRTLSGGTTRRVSVSSKGKQLRCPEYCETVEPAISANGRYIAFVSTAPNLVRRDTNKLADVFVRDLRSGKTTRVSVNSRGKQGKGDRTRTGSNAPVISGNGRYVAFHSGDTNLVKRDTNRVFDIFVHNRATHKTRRVSIGDHGQQANQESLGSVTISARGRYVAFASLATNLVAGDANDITDVFIRDLKAGKTILGSLGNTGAQGNDGSWVGGPAIQFAGGTRYLLFASWSDNLVNGDTNQWPDAFVRDFGAPLNLEGMTP
jgi:Tol biopolymer transport system component